MNITTMSFTEISLSIQEASKDTALGWGKAVPIPQNPVYVPPELLKLTLPPPQSGLPFNAQLHKDDIDRGYVVPNPYPRPLQPELESELASNSELRSMKKSYDEFTGVIRRATVKVVPPTARSVLDRIHKTIECIIKEGPVFEAIIIARESKNPAFSFLYDNQSQEHIYYRWKLYSILHGDDPYEWRTDEFRMFEGGSIWKPPPLNPYADGMPEEYIAKATSINETLASSKTAGNRPIFKEVTLDLTKSPDGTRVKGSLGIVKREMLGNLLRNLDPTKVKIGESMLFCINHADAAEEVIGCIHESLSLLETPFQKKIARLFLVSDILHNCSASVTNASYYRKGFQSRLDSIFQYLRDYLINIEDRYKADKFKQKVLSVLGAWKEWTIYEDEFVLKLSNILLGIKQEESHQTGQVTAGIVNANYESPMLVTNEPLAPNLEPQSREDDLDGTDLDDETLSKCLEAKGLSLRWYKTLELSEDEEDQVDGMERGGNESAHHRSPDSVEGGSSSKTTGGNPEKVRFKTSKWETVDPSEVAGQVVTISKWEASVNTP